MGRAILTYLVALAFVFGCGKQENLPRTADKLQQRIEQKEEQTARKPDITLDVETLVSQSIDPRLLINGNRAYLFVREGGVYKLLEIDPNQGTDLTIKCGDPNHKGGLTMDLGDGKSYTLFYDSQTEEYQLLH